MLIDYLAYMTSRLKVFAICFFLNSIRILANDQRPYLTEKFRRKEVTPRNRE